MEAIKRLLKFLCFQSYLGSSMPTRDVDSSLQAEKNTVE